MQVNASVSLCFIRGAKIIFRKDFRGSVKQGGEQLGAPALARMGGGRMGDAVRRFAWSRTPLGPPERWPAELQAAVAWVLES